MKRTPIAVDDFVIRPSDLWNNRWLLLTAGDFAAGRYNAMTVGWGSFGVMWGRPFAMVVVRPSRYTHGFMEQYETFTLCAFPPSCREALNLLGTLSGRDGDKIGRSGLTPVGATKVAAPCFDEAELVLECRKIYWDDVKPEHFLDIGIEGNYGGSDYHRIYFGEILAIARADSYAP